ncbi:MAG TPA: pyruvate ferredoxin oxidoreductase [Candidatus Moranbacteria bacterium]|nr:pyruvate ferredoxin oxidoreductase [Candidatus Moranbacteria bacterium]HAT75013.1 pyruvate ferredoxin oxidoreductase [Candidatus Moranbacteria bacterium]
MNKELTKNFASGHSACAGCGFPAIVRTILGEAAVPVVISNATGCLEVTSTLYPYSAWKVSYIHSAFANAAATISGVERAHKALLKKNVKTQNFASLPKKIKFVVFGGDGGTYDIGLQALSGALERGHNFLYVCYDNGGYMNTGNQRSSATPFGAATETTPAGKESFGKMEARKNLMEIVNAHKISYLAQANVAYIADLKMKARKALAVDGPSFLTVFSPCTNNWKFPTSQYVAVAKLATETNFWPLYEIENGEYTINWEPKSLKPVAEFLKTQGRFKHLFSEKNKPVLEKIQKMANEEFARIARLCEQKRFF